MKIVVDLDGTLVNTPELIEEIVGKPFDEIKNHGKYWETVWTEYVDEIEFYPNAVKTLLSLAEEHEVVIVTRELNEDEVREWYKNTDLHDIIPIKFIGLDFSKRKYDSKTDVVIEDLWSELRGFDGIKILFKKDYNKEDWEKADYVFDNWNEIKEILE